MSTMESNQPIDLIAKLLANENINVIRATCATASFDIKERTLRLPRWKVITDEIDQMLVAHEVGHALYTTDEYTDALINDLDFKGAGSYLNILEDARVEKLIKRKYPGIRKTFTVGYKELNDMDFFGIKQRDLQDLSLIDRINMYFKVGYSCGVQFSPEEKVFVVRAEKTETIDDVIQLAKDIWNYVGSIEKPVEDNELETGDIDDNESFDDYESDDIDDDQYNDMTDSSEEEEDEESDDDNSDNDQPSDSGSDDEEDSLNSGTDSESDSSDITASDDEEYTDDEEDDGDGITDRILSQKIAQLSDFETDYKYWKLVPQAYDTILPYKTVLQEVIRGRLNNVNEAKSEFRSFRNDTQNNVDYMIKEFHMRKAASEYKRTQVSKIGSLDTRKLWSYKINDDLFKRTAIVKSGKNHGMLFLLDWSSSMHRIMKSTIKQVLNLVMFCRQAQIPFQVLAFTDIMYSRRSAEIYRNAVDNMHGNGMYPERTSTIDLTMSKLTLLELFSSNMNTTEFNAMSALLLANDVEHTFPLNGTPLAQALGAMYNYIEKFQKTHNVEKVSFITLTDGEGLPLSDSIKQRLYINGTRINRRNFIRDEITKKSHEITELTASQMNVLLTMIKDRYNCTIVGFYLTYNRTGALRDFINAHYDIAPSDYDRVITRLRSEFKDVGYASMKGTGRDDLFVIPIEHNNINTDKLEIDGNKSARDVAKKFTKYMIKQKTSRYLLNKFIQYVA